MIRLGDPFLVSRGTVLQVTNKVFVKSEDILASLVYKKLKTIDIVQGLPKVEEILEARKRKTHCLLAPSEGRIYLRNQKIEIYRTSSEKVISIPVELKTTINFNNGEYVKFLQPLTKGPINSHDKLERLFQYYQRENSIYLACKKSFKEIQLFLVNEVQRTYLAQGVQIADKHIEIIVKQMTSKVQISEGGTTSLIPGEIFEIGEAERVARFGSLNNKEPLSYKPILLGLTKASLNSESFLSAASFQETTKVLTEAAIEGKQDWLIGLKENVIIGRLIPAGTGFNKVENFQVVRKVRTNKIKNLLVKSFSKSKFKSSVLKSRLD